MVQVLADVILTEENFAGGLRGKSMRRNARTQNQAGYVKANPIWTQTLRQYEIGFIPMIPAEWALLEAIFEVTDGGAYGFLIDDPKDRAAQASEGVVLQVGDDWILHKRYAVAGQSRDRKITRPRGTILLYIDGVPASGTVDPDTGVVTWDTDPEEGEVATWSGEFYVPVHFADDMIDWEIVASGDVEDRLVAGPTCVLVEVRE
jgi:uncharacterized protein (TIGR02217 family)